jgi:tetratricopeptide (TPR) repeat protein
MKKFYQNIIYVVVSAAAIVVLWFSCTTIQKQQKPLAAESGYVGSSDCRPCHERFYQLWAPSHHGLAMQPCTPEFAEKNLKPQKQDIVVQGLQYRFVMQPDRTFVTETGPNQKNEYPVLHAMGGKNVYYFLTELERGRLQVLPVAYDVRTDAWYDMAASAVRHFVEQPDSPYHWTDYPYTFNTSCFGCHVSQLTNQYDLKTDTYNTVWKEPGINCETCHGPAQKHIEIAKANPDANSVEDWGLVVVTPKYGFTSGQTDAACSGCHAKMSPLGTDFKPGSDFFESYDLVTYENPDYYADGRDLGENYTYTSWRQSPCVKAGNLNCLTCHTSSGRYRFHDQKANDACMPCHEANVKDFAGHTHHDPNTKVTQCVQCHMPMTRFSNMNRTDHSMRPSMPSATIQFGSPNACTMCHNDKTPEWADTYVRAWQNEDYQKETLKLGTWIKQLRQQDWSSLKEILTYIQNPDRNEIFANSMIRLLHSCPDLQKVPAMVYILEKDPSPLCRSSAAGALTDFLINKNVIDVLVEATADPYRLVRIRAASALSPVPTEQIQASRREQVQKAIEEFKAGMLSRPDDGIAYFNLGNFYMNRSDLKTAIDYFETSIRLRPDFLPAFLNISLAYNQSGENEKALSSLDKALQLEPKAAAAHLNRALLLAEMNRYSESEQDFRATLKYDPKSAVAAYNLAVLISRSNPGEALMWSRKAYELGPENEKYAYTAAYFAYMNGYQQEAVGTLQNMINNKTAYKDAYMLLAEILLKENQKAQAIQVYETAANNEKLPQQIRTFFQQQIQSLTQ